VCLRRRSAGLDEDAFTAGLVAALEETGEALVSTTRLHGRTAIRLCVLSHTSDEEHVRSAVEFLARADPVLPRETHERHPDVSAGNVLPAEERTVLELLDRNGALERSAAAGETVVRQWDTSRDFYVLLDGSAEVTVDGAPVTELGPGDFFGELAALDWGAGFGYSRLATIVARTPLRLLVVPSEQLNAQVRERPELGAAIRRAVHERLARRTP